MRKTLFLGTIVLTLLIGIGVERLYHHLTDGFSQKRIESIFSTGENMNYSPNPLDKQLIDKALSQNYSYLSSGSQSFAFESTDKEFVIKFFKGRKGKMKRTISKIFLLNNKKQKSQNAMRDTFNSCILSYLHLKEETGLLFLHLNKTKSTLPTLMFYDKLNREFQIPLDRFEFILQKKALSSQDMLLEYKKNNDFTGAINTIYKLLNLTLARSQKGYSDKDPHLIRNFGFIGKQAIEIDVGGFHRDPKKDSAYFFHHELPKIEAKLCLFLRKNYPELIVPTKQIIAQLKQNENYKPIELLNHAQKNQ
ncbi:MAG: hypothetical protein KAR79_05760 [Simkaniaceae bacterium]|nr:hypothetical protein [Simkaniaceae bacterium]